MKSLWKWRHRSGLAVVLFVSACTTASAQPPAIDGEAITGVIQRIKQDVGYYYARENQAKKTSPATDPADGGKCQMGHYDFNIDKVEVELNAIQSNTVKGDLGLKIPFGTSSIGPGGKGSHMTTASETLTIDLFPVADPNFSLPAPLMVTRPDPAQPTDQKPRFATMVTHSPPPRITPISDTLIALRNDLTAAAATKPCLETLPRKGASASDQIKIEFAVE